MIRRLIHQRDMKSYYPARTTSMSTLHIFNLHLIDCQCCQSITVHFTTVLVTLC